MVFHHYLSPHVPQRTCRNNFLARMAKPRVLKKHSDTSAEAVKKPLHWRREVVKKEQNYVQLSLITIERCLAVLSILIG